MCVEAQKKRLQRERGQARAEQPVWLAGFAQALQAGAGRPLAELAS